MSAVASVGEPGGDPTLERVNTLPRVRDYPVLSKYILCARLGSGGAGSVFMGYHTKLHRPVAIKVLNPALVGTSAAAVARFEREAIISSNLGSDHIVPVSDAATVPGTDIHYLVMDLIRGENAEERVARRGALPVSESVTIVAQACRGLVDAHSAGILHRDLKPANIMISSTGRVRLADLGIATSLDRPNLKVTQADEYLGTPQYMSPEQVHGMPLDGRSDVYSLGLTLYFLLTGVHPFPGSTPYEIMHRVTTEDLPDVRGIAPEVPPAVAKLLQAATARNPDARVPSAEAFSGRLQAAVQTVGHTDLADPAAGEDKASLYVELSENELRAISKEIERLPRGDGLSRRSKSAIIVAAVIIAAVGAAVPLLFSRSPIDRRLTVAIDGNDAPRIAELLPEAMTSSQLSDSARGGIVERTTAWLQTRGRPTEIAASMDEPPKAVLSTLASMDNNPKFAQWLAEDAKAAAKGGQWSVLLGLLGVIEKDGSNKLFGTLSEAIAPQVLESFGGTSTLTLGLEEVGIIEWLNKHTTVSPKFTRLQSLASLLRKPSPMPLRDVRQAFDDACELNAIDVVAPRLMGELRTSMAAAVNVSVDAAELLHDLYLKSKRQSAEVAALADAQIETCIKKLDWDGVRLLLEHVKLEQPADNDVRLKQVGARVLIEMAANVERDPLGTTRVKGTLPAPLLEMLVVARIQGAARWLVELRVEWTNTITSGDKFNIVDGVSHQGLNALDDLVENGIRESQNNELGRMLFIKSELATLARVDGEVQEAERARKILRALSEGVNLGNPDCAARLVHLANLLKPPGENPSLGWVARRAGEVKFSRPIPDWDQLKSLLEVGLSDNASPMYSRARSMTWHAYGTIVLAPDRRPCDRTFHRKVALQLLKALRLGNWEAAMVLSSLDKDLTDNCKNPAPDFLTPAEREEVNAKYSR